MIFISNFRYDNRKALSKLDCHINLKIFCKSGPRNVVHRWIMSRLDRTDIGAGMCMHCVRSTAGTECHEKSTVGFYDGKGRQNYTGSIL